VVISWLKFAAASTIPTCWPRIGSSGNVLEPLQQPQLRRRVPQGLQLHVPAVLRALELDHDEAGAPIHAQQVDAPLCVLEVAELLGDHEQIVAEYPDVVPQRRLQMSAFKDLFVSERRAGNRGERTVGHVVQHGGILLHDHVQAASRSISDPCCAANTGDPAREPSVDERSVEVVAHYERAKRHAHLRKCCSVGSRMPCDILD
jgi:hypothetical protein